MKKVLCFLLTAVLMVSFTGTAFAKQDRQKENNKKSTRVEQSKDNRSGKKEDKFNNSSVIKYGRYQIPVKAITKGMGATLSFDRENAVLTITKGTTTLVIDFKNKITTVNGVQDTNSGIFTAKNSRKTTVLLKYIAKVLGVRVDGNDDTNVENPNFTAAKNITLTPVGGNVVANTINSTTLYLTATAEITPGQATGGKAELYVGSKMIAATSVIAASSSAIQFTTSDNTPTNDELKTLVPEGGYVTVKLYNASNECVISKSQLRLNVDYNVPVVSGISSAVFDKSEGKLVIAVSGAAIVGDPVDVTKVTLNNTTTAKTYQLTNVDKTGSKGVVKSSSSLTILLGTADLAGVMNLGDGSLTLTIAAGSLITDTAGNTSAPFATPITVPVIVIE